MRPIETLPQFTLALRAVFTFRSLGRLTNFRVNPAAETFGFTPQVRREIVPRAEERLQQRVGVGRDARLSQFFAKLFEIDALLPGDVRHRPDGLSFPAHVSEDPGNEDLKDLVVRPEAQRFTHRLQGPR